MGGRADSASPAEPSPVTTLDPQPDAATRALEIFGELVESLDERDLTGPAAGEKGESGAAVVPLDELNLIHRRLVGQTLRRLADPSEGKVQTGADDRLEDLGRAYEALLQTSLYRTHGPAVCLKPNRYWVEVREVLEQPARTRSKWLQREAKLPKTAVQRLAGALEDAATEAAVLDALSSEQARGTPVALPGQIVVQRGAGRRRNGAHYTPRALTDLVVRRTLTPLLGAEPSSERIIDLMVCDPAMGAGAFLLEAGRFLAQALTSAWKRERTGAGKAEGLELRARRLVAEQCLFGVDRDPFAVELARLNLGLFAAPPGAVPLRLDDNLQCGNALIGERPATDYDEGGDHAVAGEQQIDWPHAFPRVFQRPRPGFDACVGNPPWVAYAGRAAQPLAPDLRHYYSTHNAAFFGYRTLHGLFIRRAAELLRGGGRLGLVVPTSVADLSGYAPTRQAHDELCEVDAELMDFGDGAFEGVFQPCMALTSTRRVGEYLAEPARGSTHRAGARPVWELERQDLDATEKALSSRLGALPALPAELFGERGLQTTKDDLAQLRRLAAPTATFRVPLREGIDISEFCAREPTLFLDPDHLVSRLRPDPDWRAVRLLIRQTARYPIAALSDGCAFRNSILAGFASTEWTAYALLAYLNSSIIRWFHYVRQRDARQGMPQLKIGHLRALPDIPLERRALLSRLHGLGKQLGDRNRGLSPSEREELDGVAFEAFGLTPRERARVTAWAAAHPVPAPRPPRE